jgi:peptide/nickel transport system permease protein
MNSDALSAAVREINSQIQLRRSSFRMFFSRRQNIAGLLLIAFFILTALAADRLAPMESPYWPSELNWADDPTGVKPHPPGDQTILGTVTVRLMHQQMDVWTVLVRGTRSALLFGVITALGTAIIGVILGAVSSWLGGWINSLIMRITDALLAFPIIVGVVVIQQLLLLATGSPFYTQVLSGEPDLASRLINLLDPVLIAIILFSWMPYARLVNTMVQRVKQTDYVKASLSLGSGPLRILFRHLIPNSISPAIVLLARDIGGFVVLQATFTFIGLGGKSEWGELLAYARDWIIGPGGNLLVRWWVFIPATVFLVLFGIGWNLLGDGLNDWLNPRTRSE